MIPAFDDILRKQDLSLEEIKVLLAAEGAEKERLLRRGLAVKLQHLDNYVHLRGLIEFGNVCEKNCFYCGLRSGNERVERYCLSDEEVLDCARLAHELGYGSVALQSGERSDPAFIDRIERLVREIKKIDNGSLGITLSLGEQTEETYRRWFEAGAHRYLLRIESSNEELYYKIHPKNSLHDFRHRVECLEILKRTGYHTGTGVMVGLPFQTLDHLAADLLFFRQMDVAMVGLGPYIPHPDTPLYKFKDLIPSAAERMDHTARAISSTRTRRVSTTRPTSASPAWTSGWRPSVTRSCITPGVIRWPSPRKPAIDGGGQSCPSALRPSSRAFCRAASR